MQFCVLYFFALFSPLAHSASPEAFNAYVREYRAPVFFSSNSSAFDARLKLLDMAPKGARAIVATFVFENGQVVRRLSRHLCLAAQRGVKTELLIDSKSGSRPGFNDIFDKGDNAQLVEELLQYLANCGVEVHVHNQQGSYVEIMGYRLPNFFRDNEMEGRKLGLVHLPLVLKRFSFLMERASAIVEEEFARAGVEVDPRPMLKNLRGFGLKLMQAMGENARDVPSLRRSYDRLLLDPVWDELSAPKVRSVLPKIEARFRSDPDFGPLGEKIRRYNRLNHRKLFQVELNGEGCMVLGGRNLGDHYLTDSAGSYLDGDVLLCRHHGSGAFEALDAGLASFRSLVSDRTDPQLRGGNDNQVLRVGPATSFVYKNLLFPAALRPEGAVAGKYRGKLKEQERTLLPEKKWAHAHAVQGDLTLGHAGGWNLLTSGWDPARDQVRAEFLRLIGAEREEIFIETAYAELDEGVRKALEAALARGVKVQLITNSFFTSDGPSGLIRILMSTWNEKMLAAYPAHFDPRYTALSGGHMTHFKFAAFGCQEGNRRAYLLGSHNFHPRSGNADKEHMLEWSETGGCEASLANVTLVRARHAFYNELSRSTRKRILDRYPDLLKELTVVGKLFREGGEGKNKLALAMREMFYEETDVDVWVPRHAARAKRFFRLLDESGLHDLMGRLL